VGKRNRQKGLRAPSSVYTDADGNELELSGSFGILARSKYNATLHGGHHRDDAWQRATELLFEQLTVAWTIHGLRTEKQGELLARYRVASGPERQFIRDTLRVHLAEHFPDVEAP
jgi:hypothetical protein